MELIDSTIDSLTVTWPMKENAIRYVLEYRSEENDEFQLLSNKLTQTQARKRNLLSGSSGKFFFRVGAIMKKKDTNDDDEVDEVEVEEDEVDQSSWETHIQPFRLLTAEEEQLQMEAPIVELAGSNQAVIISWKKKSNETNYELQMRENRGGVGWITIASSLSKVEVKKKNLISTVGYQFRIRPVVVEVDDDNDNDPYPFSPPSIPIIAKGLSDAMKRWFQSLEHGTLLKSGSSKPNDPKISLADAIGGKEFILLYASAHWCGPCRQFTPMLCNWYKQTNNSKFVEIIFVSCDHDIEGFTNYFHKSQQQPWLAIDFDDDGREQILSTMKVSGIPRLLVLHADTGRIIVDNAVRQSLDITQWRKLV